MTEEASQRLDKWLWCARFFKSRALATKMLAAGRLRLSGKVVTKAHQLVRPDDVLTFPQGLHIRVVKVLSLAVRRGPASEAQALYDDLAPIEPRETAEADGETPVKVADRSPGSGRPTKRQRRLTDRFREGAG